METIVLTCATGSAREVRAVVAGESVTLEWWRGDAWSPLTIGDLRGLLSARNGIFPWLERLGVLWGAWIGRGAEEIATFGTHAPSVPRARRRRAPSLRVRSQRYVA